MDLFRLVTLSVGGRPIEILNLEKPDTYWKERDSLKFTPGPKKQIWSQSARRYGGGRQADETHENGTVEANWVATGATERQCLTNLRALLRALERSRPGMFIEFRPDGAPFATYWELRGTATWNPDYKWVRFAGAKAIAVQVSFVVEPTGRMPRMDVADSFDVDSREDYIFDAMAEDNVAMSSSLVPVGDLASERRMIHSSRGYDLLGGQGTIFATPDSTVTGFKVGRVLRRSAPDTYVEVYVDDNGTNSRLRIDVVLAGSRTNRASVNLPVRISAGTKFAVRGRIEANVVFAEYVFLPDSLGLIGIINTFAPAGGAGYALSGAEVAALPAGKMGVSWVPQGAGARLHDYIDQPFTRRAMTTPGTVQWEDAIPGDAPALCDVSLSLPAGTPPIWGMVAWAQRPLTPLASSRVPLGVLSAESADSFGGGWTSIVADANYRGGQGRRAATLGVGSAYVQYTVDPSALTADLFTEADLDLELWARVELAGTVVSPVISAGAGPGGVGDSWGNVRYTSEWGQAGRRLVTPSGTRFRYVRLGVLPLSSDREMRTKWVLTVLATWGAGSTGSYGLDEILIVPARSRALGVTGKTASGYPRLFATTNLTQEATKTIRTDLSGVIARPPFERANDAGLGGSPIELPPGHVDTIVKMSSLVPDDPTPNSADSEASLGQYVPAVHLSVTPRVHLFRDE